MKTEILTLCDYASDNEGKLTIVGTFDTIIASKFPWRTYFYAVARIDLEENIPIDKSLTISIVSKNDEDEEIFTTSETITQESYKLNIVAGFKGLIFETSGNYAFRVTIDNNIITEYLFKVIIKDR